MKIYIMSRSVDGKAILPKASRDFLNLECEMIAEYEKVLADAGKLGSMWSDENSIYVKNGAVIHQWRIDPVIC